MSGNEPPDDGNVLDVTKPGEVFNLSARPYLGSNPKPGITQAHEAKSYLFFRNMFLLRLMPMLLHDWFLQEKSPKLAGRDPECVTVGHALCPSLGEHDGMGLVNGMAVQPTDGPTARAKVLLLMHMYLIPGGTWANLFVSVVKKKLPIAWWFGKMDQWNL